MRQIEHGVNNSEQQKTPRLTSRMRYHQPRLQRLKPLLIWLEAFAFSEQYMLVQQRHFQGISPPTHLLPHRRPRASREGCVVVNLLSASSQTHLSIASQNNAILPP